MGRSLADLGRQRGSSWETFWDLSGVKKGQEKSYEKRPRLARSWVGVDLTDLVSLGAGGDKGET